jgi:SAM-dependent methyltransferase
VDAGVRDAFLHGAESRRPAIPPAVRARLSALLQALDSPTRDPRLTYFRSLVTAETPPSAGREPWLAREYVRVMRFVYQKEFVAQRSEHAADAVAELYRTRGLSTDTAVEAGYLVSQGLGVVKALAPDSRIRRVLIIGPGLDLAPRTGLIEEGPPESYQPWAVIDALLSLGLSRADDLAVVGADINPRVVEHLRRAHATPPRLTLVSEIGESDRISFTPEFRDYFTGLGRSIGEIGPGPADGPAGHLGKTIRVGAAAARVLNAEQLDIVTERLTGTPFDLVVVTNVLPYFDDVELMLALRNIAGMLAPGGVLLHNEARPLLGDVTAALGLPVEQSRHAIIATVRGAAAPLFDSIWLHRFNGLPGGPIRGR